MKKFLLTVSEPCHEKWDVMTPEQKGRFCTACQKTVVDFTGMSDRQITEFFRQPAGSVCGRFYNDQLNRPFAVQGKKLQLPKHFFRYSWPAFLLLLKSCDPKVDDSFDTLIGVVVETSVTAEVPVMGEVQPQITPVDSSLLHFPKPVPIKCTQTVGITSVVLKGDTTVVVVENEPEKDSLQAVDYPFVAVDSTWVDIDALRITGYPEKEEIMMGAVVVTPCTKAADEKVINTTKTTIDKQENPGVVIYPNPLAKGQTLNVQFKQPFAGVYQLYEVSGQVVQTGKIAVGKDQRFTIPPQDLSAGGYFLRLTDEKTKKVITEKFIVQ